MPVGLLSRIRREGQVGPIAQLNGRRARAAEKDEPDQERRNAPGPVTPQSRRADRCRGVLRPHPALWRNRAEPGRPLPRTRSRDLRRVHSARDERHSLDVKSEEGVVTITAADLLPPVARISAAGRLRPANRGSLAASTYTVFGQSRDPNAIDADLGPLGRISVVFQPSGAVHTSTSSTSATSRSDASPRAESSVDSATSPAGSNLPARTASRQ
jgi:hypothetical protein